MSGPAGLFGKAPFAGDFLRRNLSPERAGWLEAWLGLEFDRLSQTPGDWRDDFDAAPFWRFVAPPQDGARWPLAAVIGPGRDRVGRRFPCMVCADARDLDVSQSLTCTVWFDEAETLLTQLAVERVADVDAGLAALGVVRADDDALTLRKRETDDGLFIDVRGRLDGRPAALAAALADAAPASGGVVAWRATPVGLQLMVTPQLPAGQAFAALFRPGAGAAAAAAA